MDSNGLRFWMMSDRSDWLPAAGLAGLAYCSTQNRLQLRSQRNGNPPAEDFTIASQLVETTPMTRDRFGNYARWDAASGHVVSGGSAPGEVPIYVPPVLAAVTGLVAGDDGVLYVAVAGTLVLIDLSGRWPNFTLSDPTFQFWRLAAVPGGGVLALDRNKSQLGRISGLPLQEEPDESSNPGILLSCQANPDPPHITARYDLPVTEVFIAIAPMGNAQFALLSWAQNSAANQKAYLRTFSETALLGAPRELQSARFPYSVAWLGGQRFAALASNSNEALIYDFEDTSATAEPAGETLILSRLNAGPFAHSFDLPPYYADGTQLMPLLPLSLNAFAASGATDPTQPKVIDSGAAQTVWHRVFLEAVVPPRCGALILLAASDRAADLTGSAIEWFPHILGSVAVNLAAPLAPDTPRAVWQAIPSEVPLAPSMLAEAAIKDRQGLFMALIQRVGKAVRTLRGRYLGVRVQLNGDRRSTPEIAALRVYGSRFSYVGNYLPEIYREGRFGTAADENRAATRHDFFDRFVNIFENQMTRIEDRVASAYLLTRPETTPDDSLDWLGSWIGLDPKAYPPPRRRARLLAAPELRRKRGSVAAITKAIDVATDGLCSRGAVLVIENFRMRHTFDTILGANLSDRNDPLLPGYSGSANSFVGDTLFLGDQLRDEFLSLFAPGIATPAEEQQVQQFFDNFAHRITILIHDQVEPVDRNLVQRIVEQEKPAHVAASYLRATQPFLVGIASLLGINSYQANEPPPARATVDASRIGRYGLIDHLASLDPRLENGIAATSEGQPVARIAAPKAVLPGDPVRLDGSDSAPPPKGSLEHFQWNLGKQS